MTSKCKVAFKVHTNKWKFKLKVQKIGKTLKKKLPVFEWMLFSGNTTKTSLEFSLSSSHTETLFSLP